MGIFATERSQQLFAALIRRKIDPCSKGISYYGLSACGGAWEETLDQQGTTYTDANLVQCTCQRSPDASRYSTGFLWCLYCCN